MASDRERFIEDYPSAPIPQLRENKVATPLLKPIAVESVGRMIETLQIENGRLIDQINDRDNRIEQLEGELRTIRNMSDEITKRYAPQQGSGALAGSGIAGRAF